MCDAVDAVTGYLTSIDMQNAQKYARMKILYEQTQKYKGKLAWIDTNGDGSPTYYCPPGLTDCKDGYARIAYKTECENISVSDIQDIENENANNGYYLEWRTGNDNQGNKIDPTSPEAETNGQCYRASAKFRSQCNSGNFSGDDKNHAPPVPGLYYDNNTGRCFITQQYCQNIGDLTYNPPSNNIPEYIRKMSRPGDDGIDGIGFGGSCDMNGGQKFADYIFGDTVARGVFGGKCFK
jgi:hypothetical protein